MEQRHQELVSAVEMQGSPTLVSSKWMRIPGRTLAVLNVQSNVKEIDTGQIYDVQVNPLLSHEHPNLSIVPTIHRVDCASPEIVPFMTINLSYDPIEIDKGMVMGFLVAENIDVSEIVTETSVTSSLVSNEGYESEEKLLDEPVEIPKEGFAFITSPADIDVHRKVELKNAEVSEEDRKAFEEICKRYEDVFLVDSTDIGKYPLMKMDIETGDSPPICQKPYNLLLKHAEWVKRELNILEQARVIVKSISPWASPIVVVPKRSAPGEPLKRRLCVDYRALNTLLPPVKKAHSNAKGVLSLVPLPKIDEIYARLRGSKVYSAVDVRSGYHHLALNKKSQAKSAFVSPLGKWEFNRCPFGLAQAPAYFQKLINEVLAPFDFAFGYLGDILIFSPDITTHLQHIEMIFQ